MFSWDIRKAISNYEKHGVSFEEVATVFADIQGLHFDDILHSTSERRFKQLGRSAAGRILLVVYTLRRQNNGTETVRIISARQASRKERAAYAGRSD